MRKQFLNLMIIFGMIAWSPFSFASTGQIEAFSKIPLGSVKPPEVKIQTLSNGMKLYLLEDHELPIFEVFAYIRAGSIYDPADKVGLSSILGTVLRSGGTTQHSSNDLDRILENEGASLETGMSAEYASASLSCLSKDISQMLPLFFEVLSSPLFKEEKTQLAIARRIEGLKRINDEPDKIAVREYPKLLYGKESVWARTPTSQSLKNIHREDLLRTHQKFYHPENIILAVSGDFKSDELIALLEKSSSSWSKSKEVLPTLPPVEKKWDRGIYLIDKPGGQSTLLVGHYGDKRSNPDKFALILMNYMLGGDIFSSRLGEEIRSNRGLAYSIYSKFGLDTEYGLFYAMAQTKTSSTVEVIQLIEKEILSFHNGKGFSSQSFEFAKASILNQLMGDWDPRFNYVKERARLSYYHYPENYLDVFQKKLAEVTLSQVQAVARKYLFPEKLKILVVGEGKQMKPGLEKLGEVKELPLPTY